MNVLEFMRTLDSEDFQTPGTVDCFKYGDTEREVKKVVTCLTATPNVLRAAKEYGADLIITHEPTYYQHTDVIYHNPIVDKKLALVEETGIPICRYHDHMHFDGNDMISEGFLKTVKWKGTFDGTKEFVLDEPMTPLQIAKDVEEKLGLAHVRIIGKRDGLVKNVALFLGHRGDDWWIPFKTASTDDQVALAGEWCEWYDGEMIRDAAEFGVQLTAIVLGHAGSERAGMKILADSINERFSADSIEAKYIECGELYTYTD